jgi:hypothetical protein
LEMRRPSCEKMNDLDPASGSARCRSRPTILTPDPFGTFRQGGNLPDRAWRFGPTKALSRRGDRILDFGFWICDFGFAERRSRRRSRRYRQHCQRRSVGYPRAGAERLAPNKHRQARSARPSLASDQRQLSVGGAITHFRCRLLRESNRHPQRGSRMRRHRWLQANERRRRSLRPKCSVRASVEIRSGKNFRDCCVNRVS